MKIKKKNSNKDFFLFDVVVKEKYLFLFILIVSIAFTLSSNFKKSSKLQEINSKAFIEFPNTSNELFYLTNELSNFKTNNSTYPSDFKYFNNKFSYDLSSLDNLLDFLNQEKNFKYLEIFNNNNLDAETYLRENFKLLKDTEFDNDFLIILLMKHPIDFDGKLFLNDYIEFVALETTSEFITSKLKLSNSILDLLNKKIIIQKEWEKNRSVNYKELLGTYKDKHRIIELVNIFSNYMAENENSSLFFSQTHSDIIVSQINLVKELTDKIGKISFEPKYEIQSDKTVYVQNYLIRNLVLNIIISFVIFFSIISFKQIFKKFLN